MKDLYMQLLSTARNANLEIIRREKAAKLLALCFVYGDEPFVLSKKLHADTMESARIMGIGPMMVPNLDDTALIQARYKEVMLNRADWKASIEAEYGISFPEIKDGSVCVPESKYGETGRG